MQVPILVRGRLVSWIDSKAMFGDERTHGCASSVAVATYRWSYVRPGIQPASKSLHLRTLMDQGLFEVIRCTKVFKAEFIVLVAFMLVLIKLIRIKFNL